MTGYSILQPLPDATLESYERDQTGQLTLRIRLWNDKVLEVLATGTDKVEDLGACEIDALVSLDVNGVDGYGIVDSDGNVTLRFVAERLTGLPTEGEDH